MKSMNYLLAIALLVTVGSCSKETEVQDGENEALAAIDFRGRMAQEKEKPQEIFELDIHQFYVLGEISQLNKEKRKLEEAIDGGSEKLISELESVSSEIKEKMKILKTILDDTCYFLKINEAKLKKRAWRSRWDRSQWLEAKELLENCGEDTETYAAGEKMEVRLAYRITDLDECIPQREWGCENDLAAGPLVINLIETSGPNPEIYFSGENNEVIDRGRNLGRHQELEGVYQVVIILSAINEGTLQFAQKEYSYGQRIRVKQF